MIAATNSFPYCCYYCLLLLKLLLVLVLLQLPSIHPLGLSQTEVTLQAAATSQLQMYVCDLSCRSLTQPQALTI